jgi:hypothetical protein
LDVDYLEQPEEELAMASLRSVPDALDGWLDADDGVVGDGDVLGAMPASGGQEWWRRHIAVGNTERLPAVGNIQRSSTILSEVPARPVVEAAKERQGQRP